MGDTQASGSRSRKSIAFLGPEGTYGQQAARQFVQTGRIKLDPQELDWIPCPTITDVYNCQASYTVLPLQNTIFGAVNETLDCLLTRLNTNTPKGEQKQKGKQIVDSLDLPIQHCLVVKRGTRMGDIQWVKSHEQAIGQSTKFLDKYLPHAKRISTASTALAAQSLFDADADAEVAEGAGGGVRAGTGAAICSKSVVEGDDRLEVLHHGTQDRDGNYTRFILLVDPQHLGNVPELPRSESGRISHFFVLPMSGGILDLPRIEGSMINAIHTRPLPSDNDNNDKGRYPMGLLVELVGLPEIEAEIGRRGESEAVAVPVLIGSAPYAQTQT